jgi:hypothetical protein
MDWSTSYWIGRNQLPAVGTRKSEIEMFVEEEKTVADDKLWLPRQTQLN